MGASVTDRAGVVISGKHSLLADFTREEGSWHEFLHTNDAVRFEKGKVYAVRFKHRIVSNEDAKIEFYSQLRSRAGKGDVQGDNWRWRRPTGHSGHINRLFEIPEDGGYYLIAGVKHAGAIAIDDLEIREARPNEAAAAIAVETHPSLLDQPRRVFDRLHNPINRLMNDMLIIALSEGASTKATSRKDAIAADLQIDFVDWNPFGELARQHGIRTSRGGCEYQEYYKFEGSPDPAVREQVWNNRYELFGESGFVITLENTILADESWGEGGYFTCHNGPNWHQHFLESLAPRVQKHLAITQDNIACSVFNRVRGCYCPGCQTRFRNLLAERFSRTALASAGIDDPDAFSIQDYIVGHGLLDRPALEDAIVRAYIKFQYITGLLAWADCVDRAKGLASRQGRPLPCGGNQINIWGTWPYAVMLSQFCDFVEVEELVGVKEKVDARTLQYKLGLASGHHERPVWVRGPVTDETREKMPMLSTSYWAVHFAEALANGGIRAFSLGLNKPYTGEPDVPDYLDDPELYRLYVDFARWMREHRSLLTHRDSAARVAVVYSLPALMFRRYDALRTPDDQRLPKFMDVVKFLDRHQIPCDVVVFGHPEVWDDTKTFARLRSRYDVIVLPGVDALTEDQLKLLAQRAKVGVTLLADEPFARDENLNLRAAIPAEPRAVALTDQNLLRFGRQVSPVQADLPEHVSVNAWRSCGGKSFDVHLLNYDADVPGEKMRPVENVELRIQVPADLKLERCLLSQFGDEDREIRFTRNEGWITVRLPRLDAYAIVSFTDQRSIDTTRRLAEQRRTADRRAVQRLAERHDLY